MVSILAIDPGRRTGYAHSAGHVGLSQLGPEGPEHAGLRLATLADFVRRTHGQIPFERLVVEDAPYGAQGQFRTALAQSEYTGVLRLVAFELRVQFELLNPATWKSWLTGKVFAKKEQVAAALWRHYGRQFDDDNQADAFAILMAAQAGVRPQPKKTKKRRVKAGKPKEKRLF